MQKRSTFVLIGSFFVGLLGLNLLLLLSNNITQVINPFDPSFSGLKAQTNRLGVRDLLAAKYHHAVLRKKQYDIGVFGNSRSAMVSRGDVSLPNLDFFNFSVGGTSFIQSVTLLEELAEQGVAPKTAIISIDHPELQFIEFLYFPEPIFRPADYAGDVLTILHDGVGTRRQRRSDAVKVIDWAHKQSWARFRENWNVDTLTRRIGYFRAASVDRQEDGVNPTNRIDGSHEQILPEQQLSFADFEPGSPAFRAHNRFVFIGSKRLAALKRQNKIRIVVYESPLAPEINKIRSENTSPQALESRRWFNAGCQDSSVECIFAPVLPSVPNLNWPDCCHPPARVLGGFFDRLVQMPAT